MKNRLNKTALIILCLFAPVLSNGQEIDLNLLKLDDYVRFHNHEASRTINSYQQIEGTPYLYEEFKKGIVTLRDSSSYKGLFRYDIYADKIEFKSMNFIFLFRDPWTIEILEFASHTFIYIPPHDETSKRGAYYELIVPGQCRLLERRRVALNKPQPPKPYTKAKPASFSKRKSDYYIQLGDQAPQRVSGKKSFVKAFENQGHKISVYMRKNKMSIKKTADLVELVNYYNSL